MDSRSVVPFILVALAVYRASYMIVAEDGPFNIFGNWRHFLRGREILRGKSAWWIDGWFCQLCVSFHLGFIGALVIPFSTWYEYVVIALALSGVTLLIKKRLG